MTGSILKIALMKESLSVRSPNISARILPRSQKKYGATGSSIHGTAAVLQTPIIFANTATIARRQMPVENTMLRMIIPSGTILAGYTQWDIRRAVDHVNNAPRKNLDGRTPYEIAVKTFGPEVLKQLQLRYVAPDEVTLSPKLLK